MRFSERIYLILLKAYPTRYLRRYEEPMAQLFSDQLQRANGAGQLAYGYERWSIFFVPRQHGV